MNTFEFAKEMGMKLYNGNEFLLKVELIEKCPNGYKEIAMVDDFGFPLTLCTDGEDIKAYIDFPEEDNEDEVAEINVAKKPTDVFNDDINGILKCECPNCHKEFYLAPRCPECGQLIKVKEETNMEIIREIECECYDDFYTQWFKLTEDVIFNSIRRAELMGFLANKEEKGVFYIGIKEDDWDCHKCKEFLDGEMDKYYECEFFTDDRFPIIREIEIKKPTMFERILKTVEAKLEVDGEIIEWEEKNGEKPYISTQDLKEQIEWLKEQIRKENN